MGNSVWFPDRGETEGDGVERVERRGTNAFDSVREMVEAIAERDWARSDYWNEETVRARWMGVAYEFRVTVRSEPVFEYEGKELPDDSAIRTHRALAKGGAMKAVLEELERLEKAATQASVAAGVEPMTPEQWLRASAETWPENGRSRLVLTFAAEVVSALPALLAAARRVEELEIAMDVARKNESDAHHKRGEALEQLTAANARVAELEAMRDAQCGQDAGLINVALARADAAEAKVEELAQWASDLETLVDRSSRWIHDSTLWESDEDLAPAWQALWNRRPDAAKVPR